MDMKLQSKPIPMLKVRMANFEIYNDDLIVEIPYNKSGFAKRKYKQITKKDQVEDQYVQKFGAICRFKIYRNNLYIVFDYENGGFAEWKYLDLIGVTPEQIRELTVKQNRTITHLVAEQYMERQEITA